jgi:hypothetical protein
MRGSTWAIVLLGWKHAERMEATTGQENTSFQAHAAPTPDLAFVPLGASVAL